MLLIFMFMCNEFQRKTFWSIHVGACRECCPVVAMWRDVRLKSWIIKVLQCLVLVPLLLWLIALLKVWLDVQKDQPTDVINFPMPHFQISNPVGPPPADFCDPWYCAVDCTFGQPCGYRDEVDLRIIVMTYDRAKSLGNCLDFIHNLDTLNDTVSVEIWADLFPNGSVSNSVEATAEKFREKWSKSHQKRRVCFHKQKGKAHIGGQWVDTWRPREDSGELGLILEDDIMISPHAYRWLKAVHAHYGHLSDVAGYTFQMEDTQMFAPVYEVHAMEVDSEQTVFMYPVIGTWGFAPHPTAWRHFQDWYHTVRPDRDVTTDHIVPRVPGILPDRWYRMFRGRGLQETMWSMWHIKFTHDQRQFTVYSNMKRHLGRSDVLLSSNRKEPGLHFKGNGMDNTMNLLRVWEPEFVQFPQQTLQLNYNGKTCTSECCFSAVCESVLKRYFSQSSRDILRSLLPWKGASV